LTEVQCGILSQRQTPRKTLRFYIDSTNVTVVPALSTVDIVSGYGTFSASATMIDGMTGAFEITAVIYDLITDLDLATSATVTVLGV